MTNNNALNNFAQRGANGNPFLHYFIRNINNAQKLRELKNTKPQAKLDLSTCYNVIGNLGKIGYVAGSKIELIISKTSVCEALKDMELNAQFLTNGEVDFFKLALLFPQIGVEGSMDGYVSIFSEKEYIQVTDKKKRTSKILKACKSKIKYFLERLRALRSCSQEDLVLIGKDLEIIATVMSELEIDAAKEENKRKGMLKIEDFMNPKFKQRAREIEVIHNYDDIVNSKKGYSKEQVTELVYELEKYPTLFDFDEIFEARKEAFLNKLKEDKTVLTEEEMAERICNIKFAVREDCMVLDPLFQVVEVMLESIKETLVGFNNFYVNSDMTLFENLCFDPQRDLEEDITGESDEEAVKSIRQTAVIAYEMINNIFAYGKYMSMNKVEDVAKIARNIVYTAGDIRGYSAHETFLIAVDAGWYKRCYNEKGQVYLSKSKNFKYAAVKALFETELKYYFNADAMRKEADLQIPDELLDLDVLHEGAVLEFYNGQCTIEMEDDEYTILRADDTRFTGSILIDADEDDYAVFVEEANQYEFEMVDYVIFDNIADVLHSENRLEPGTLEALSVEAETTAGVFGKEYAKYKLIPKTKSDEGQGFLNDKEKQDEANRVAPILKKWCDTFALCPVLRLDFGVKENHYYLHNEEGVGKIMGKMHDSYVDEDAEYSSIFAIATSVGAIVIKESEEDEECDEDEIEE